MLHLSDYLKKDKPYKQELTLKRPKDLGRDITVESFWLWVEGSDGDKAEGLFRWAMPLTTLDVMFAEPIYRQTIGSSIPIMVQKHTMPKLRASIAFEEFPEFDKERAHINNNNPLSNWASECLPNAESFFKPGKEYKKKAVIIGFFEQEVIQMELDGTFVYDLTYDYSSKTQITYVSDTVYGVINFSLSVDNLKFSSVSNDRVKRESVVVDNQEVILLKYNQ